MNADWYTAVAARPTTYRGRRYRSRLEARWAAFFDALGWKFEYEPFDLHGWVPDFVLIGAQELSVLVEVKPIVHFDQAVADKIVRALPAGQEALLVGCCLPGAEISQDHHPCIGWLAEWHDAVQGYDHCTGEHRWDLAPFGWYEARPDFADFTSQYGFYGGRLTGEYDGGRWGGADARIDVINEAWGHAAWQVQWRAESGR